MPGNQAFISHRNSVVLSLCKAEPVLMDEYKENSESMAGNEKYLITSYLQICDLFFKRNGKRKDRSFSHFGFKPYFTTQHFYISSGN